jgi:hypothetical protein
MTGALAPFSYLVGYKRLINQFILVSTCTNQAFCWPNACQQNDMVTAICWQNAIRKNVFCLKDVEP